MGYLQLAENADPNLVHLAETTVKNADKYVFIPQGYRGAEKDLYVREDLFDNLPETVYQNLMFELEPFQNQGLSGKMADRRAARRDARQKRIETRAGSRAAGTSFLDKIGGVAGNILGGLKGGSIDVQTGPGEFSVDYSGEPSFFEKYKIPILFGGAALIGGGIYLVTRKKK
jgi:hypothetical protein